MSFNSTGRQSPFKRQNSVSPATPTQSPTKFNNPAPAKQNSLSPDKASPFTRRPSTLNNSASERPASAFARPSSSLAAPASPSRQASNASFASDAIESPQTSRQRSMTPNLQSPSKLDRPTSLAPDSPSPFDGATYDAPPPAKANYSHGASFSSTVTQTAPAIKSANFQQRKSTFAPAAGPYSHVPQGLLRSMRESFEVLDSSNSGKLTSASIAPVLSQIGIETDLGTFFPAATAASSLNLAKYLDLLSAPLAELSSQNELAAAFGAFDIDDSGQIDVAELRRALLETVPEVGEGGAVLSEREVDGILGQFAGRRAFGGKGLGANAAKGRGEVFKYREFMANVGGGGVDVGGEDQGIMA